MKELKFFPFLFFLFMFGKSSSQDFIINQPRLESEGNNLVISYDIITKNKPDQFYVWFEIERANGEKIEPKSLSGDIGEFQKAGSNKKIVWASDQDSVIINEEIFVTVKAEKYIKSFNKSSVLLKSAIFPGWGQTKVSKGKPWWLTGVAFYGALTGGYLFNQKYLSNYDSYKLEEDRSKRIELLDKTQKQLNTSTGLLYSAAAVWAINILWVGLTPSKYEPLQHTKFSINPSPALFNKGITVSLRMDF